MAAQVKQKVVVAPLPDLSKPSSTVSVFDHVTAFGVNKEQRMGRFRGRMAMKPG